MERGDGSFVPLSAVRVQWFSFFVLGEIASIFSQLLIYIMLRNGHILITSTDNINRQTKRKEELDMLTLVILFFAFAFCGRLIGFAFKATWNIAKFFLFVVFLPAMLVIAIIGGLISLAWPILIIAGIVLIVKNCTRCA